MDTARCYQQFDPKLNPHFRRRWAERYQPQPVAADDGAATEPALATVMRWRDEWRRAARPEPTR